MKGARPSEHIREVAPEDLLGRPLVSIDVEPLRKRIQGKVVMVTGAAGSIGSELCRQIASFGPKALVGFDQAETPLFYLERELSERFPGLAFQPEIGSVTRFDDVNWTMRKYRPSIVYHAAAYKHVSMMERQVFAAVENNVFGSWQVALAAASYQVDYFVMMSTDKAVRPASLMGATKRAAELAIRALQKQGGTRFVAVRFGNVLGSSGSVLPIFMDQIAAGGPVTVTHPDMRRYFMTAQEAAQLVLGAFVRGKGGEVFVLDMGAPVSILELARNLIRLSGFQPDKDIEIEFIGARPGEKLFEELNLRAELLAKTSHPRICSLISSDDVDETRVRAHLDNLRQAIDSRDALRIVLLLEEMVPDYEPSAQLLNAAIAEQANRSDAREDRLSSRQSERPTPLIPAAASE